MSTNIRKTARQRRKISPYTTPSSPGRSARSDSPLDPSTFSSSILLADDHVEEGSKNTFAAYNTELTTKRAQVNDLYLAPNTPPEYAPLLISGLSTASESPVAEQSKLSALEQGDLYAVDATAQLVTEMTSSDEVFSNFLAQFNDWQPEAISAHNALSLHTPVVQHAIDNAPLSSLAALPSYEVQPTVNNAPYEYYGYSTEAVSLDAQFPQLDQFTTRNTVGVYPQVLYPQDVDQGCLYNPYAGTNAFAMQGLCLY